MNFQYEGALLNELRSFGLLIDSLKFGQSIQRCKAENSKRGDVPGWYRIFEHRDGHLVCVYGDWRQGNKRVWRSYSGRELSPQKKAQEDQWLKELKEQQEAEAKEKSAKAAYSIQRILNACQEIAPGSPVHNHLLSRKCLQSGSLVPTPAEGYDLLEHPNLDYWDSDGHHATYPAMIGLIKDPKGNIVALHRTYLNEDGSAKADVPTPRKATSGCAPTTGAAIRLGIPETNSKSGNLCLGIAEGIETALSAALIYQVPVWAAYCAPKLKTFEPPEDLGNIQEIKVFADTDENQTGQKAARACCERLVRKGFRTYYAAPREPGTDFNDLWIAMCQNTDGVN